MTTRARADYYRRGLELAEAGTLGQLGAESAWPMAAATGQETKTATGHSEQAAAGAEMRQT